jgi:hypothetical protein
MLTSFFARVICIFILPQILLIYPVKAETVKVECRDDPVKGVVDLTYETVWEQSAETDNYLIGRMIDASYDRSGNICIVDYQQKNLVILDPEGSWLQTIGREGEGPGELQDARKLFFDGSRYGLLQATPGAIVWFNFDGTPSGKARIGNEDMSYPSVTHAMQNGTNIYAWISELRQTDSGYESVSWISRIEATGVIGPVLYTPPDGPDSAVNNGIDEGKVYDIWLRRWIGDKNGGVWVAPERDRYMLQYWNSKGDLELEVTKKYKLVERNENGRERIISWFKKRGWSTDEIHVGKSAPVVRSLRLGDDEALWVRLDQGGKSPGSDIIAVYDIFTPSGQYQRRIRMHCGLDVVLVLTANSDGEMIICLQRTTDGGQ